MLLAGGTTDRSLEQQAELANSNLVATRCAGAQERAHTILVVDDDDAVRSFIAASLEPNGLAVLNARSTEEGLRLFEEYQGTIHVAIIDMMLPGRSGLDLAAELERRVPELKILYVSGYVNSIAIECIARKSPAAVLLKPFQETDLLARVFHFLHQPTNREERNGPDSRDQHKYLRSC
jgi:DNA-binding response OmpR family regulator